MFIVSERSNSVFLLDNVEETNSYDLSEVHKARVGMASCSLNKLDRRYLRHFRDPLALK